MSELLAERASPARVLLALLELTKPRIVMLVLLTGVPALLMAAHGWPEPKLAVGALLGTALAAASAAAMTEAQRTSRSPMAPARAAT